MSGHRYAYPVAVVGDGSVMSSGDLWSLLDLLVNRVVGERRVVLLSSRLAPDEAGLWAAGRGHSVQLVAADNAVRLACGIVEQAAALVVLGDPARWSKLIDLARDAGVAVRVYRTRPKLPAPKPEWDLSDLLPPPEFDPTSKE